MYNPVPLLLLTLAVDSSRGKFRCPGPGFFPDPESCTAFYRCVNRSTSYRYICPLGTRYDPTVSNCNHVFLAPPCKIQSSSIRPGSSASQQQVTGQESGQSEIQESGVQGSGQNVVQESGQSAAQGTGQTVIQESGQSAAQGTGQDIVQESGQNLVQDSGQDIVQESVQDAGQPSQESHPTEIDSSQGTNVGIQSSSDSNPTQEGGSQETAGGQPVSSSDSSNHEGDQSAGGLGPTQGQHTDDNDPQTGSEQTESSLVQGSSTSDFDPVTDINIPNQSQAPITRPGQSTVPISPTSPSSPSSPTSASSQYTVSPDSLYPCMEPGYYKEASNCRDFYMCKEISPGILSAERLFRCPDRYLFDPLTRLCQRREKVECVEEVTYNSLRSSFVSQLSEFELDNFFSQPLTISRAKKPGFVYPLLPSLVGGYVDNRLQQIPAFHPTYRYSPVRRISYIPSPLYNIFRF